MPPVRSLGGPYGNGPYRKAECPPNGTRRRVAGRHRRQAPRIAAARGHQLGGRLDWQPFDDARAQAAAAAESGDYAAAIRQYCQAIRDIMQQFREHRPTVDTVDARATRLTCSQRRPDRRIADADRQRVAVARVNEVAMLALELSFAACSATC